MHAIKMTKIGQNKLLFSIIRLKSGQAKLANTFESLGRTQWQQSHIWKCKVTVDSCDNIIKCKHHHSLYGFKQRNELPVLCCLSPLLIKWSSSTILLLLPSNLIPHTARYWCRQAWIYSGHESNHHGCLFSFHPWCSCHHPRVILQRREEKGKFGRGSSRDSQTSSESRNYIMCYS